MYNPAMTPQPPSPMLIFETLQAHQQTSALRAGIDLKLFTAIAGGARTPEALAPLCGASLKGLRILCDFLTIRGFLTKDEAGYGLTADSETLSGGGVAGLLGWHGDVRFSSVHGEGNDARHRCGSQGRNGVPDEGSVSYDNPVWVDFARGMAPLMGAFGGSDCATVGRHGSAEGSGYCRRSWDVRPHDRPAESVRRNLCAGLEECAGSGA